MFGLGAMELLIIGAVVAVLGAIIVAVTVAVLAGKGSKRE